MGNTVDISAFSSELGTILSRYSKNIDNETENWMQATAKRTAKKVKEKAPPNAPSAYKSGIRATKVGGKWVVYASKKTGLGHLMENSHPIIAHGVVVKASSDNYPHFKPAEDAIQEDIDLLAKQLGKVGA